MARKYKPTFEEYERMGAQFKLLNDFVVITDVFVSQKIGTTKTNKLCNFRKITKDLNHIISELEEMMFRDYPEQSSTRVFYGERDSLKDRIHEVFR